jgi:hypothetical protein
MYGETNTSLALFVLEAGAAWPRWGQLEARRRATNSMVDAQAGDESISGFARRVVGRIDTVCRSSKALAYAAIITAPQTHGEQMPSRVQIARALVRALSDSGGGSLVLAPSTPSTVSEREKHELFALAGTLCEELSGRDVVVSVRLHATRPAGGRLRWSRPERDLSGEQRVSRGHS